MKWAAMKKDNENAILRKALSIVTGQTNNNFAPPSNFGYFPNAPFLSNGVQMMNPRNPVWRY